MKTRHIGFLTCIFLLASLFSTGWYVRSSWIAKVSNRDLKIRMLRSELSGLSYEKKKVAKDYGAQIADKDQQICQLIQEYEAEICAKNEQIDRLGFELASRAQKRNAKAQQIRRFLQSRGSPMASTAEELVIIAESHNIDPFLLVGIAGVESSFGQHCYGYNPFGYLQNGAGSGLRRYQSWVDGYVAICRFIRSSWGKTGRFIYSATQLRGYCCPDHPWMEKVNAISAAF